MRTSIKAFASVAGLSAVLATGAFIGQAMAGQPHMANALAALQTARSELTVAASDKGGHRIAALRLINEAIAETRAGMIHAATH